MSCYLMQTAYDERSELNMSDQITVPAAIWEQFEQYRYSDQPIFVSVGSAVGRLRPATVDDNLAGDSCRLPEWMYRSLDFAEWVELMFCDLPTAGLITLRARHEAVLTGSANPVAMLTSALSGESGAPSWACLSVGSELPLVCGVFDIMGIQSIDGRDVPAACILNCDVKLDIMEALDHVRDPEPPVPESPVPGRFVPFSGVGRRLGS